MNHLLKYLVGWSSSVYIKDWLSKELSLSQLTVNSPEDIRINSLALNVNKINELHCFPFKFERVSIQQAILTSPIIELHHVQILITPRKDSDVSQFQTPLFTENMEVFKILDAALGRTIEQCKIYDLEIIFEFMSSILQKKVRFELRAPVINYQNISLLNPTIPDNSEYSIKSFSFLEGGIKIQVREEWGDPYTILQIQSDKEENNSSRQSDQDNGPNGSIANSMFDNVGADSIEIRFPKSTEASGTANNIDHEVRIRVKIGKLRISVSSNYLALLREFIDIFRIEVEEDEDLPQKTEVKEPVVFQSVIKHVAVESIYLDFTSEPQFKDSDREDTDDDEEFLDPPDDDESDSVSVVGKSKLGTPQQHTKEESDNNYHIFKERMTAQMKIEENHNLSLIFDLFIKQGSVSFVYDSSVAGLMDLFLEMDPLSSMSSSLGAGVDCDLKDEPYHLNIGADHMTVDFEDLEANQYFPSLVKQTRRDHGDLIFSVDVAIDSVDVYESIIKTMDKIPQSSGPMDEQKLSVDGNEKPHSRSSQKRSLKKRTKDDEEEQQIILQSLIRVPYVVQHQVLRFCFPIRNQFLHDDLTAGVKLDRRRSFVHFYQKRSDRDRMRSSKNEGFKYTVLFDLYNPSFEIEPSARDRFYKFLQMVEEILKFVASVDQDEEDEVLGGSVDVPAAPEAKKEEEVFTKIIVKCEDLQIVFKPILLPSAAVLTVKNLIMCTRPPIINSSFTVYDVDLSNLGLYISKDLWGIDQSKDNNGNNKNRRGEEEVSVLDSGWREKGNFVDIANIKLLSLYVKMCIDSEMYNDRNIGGVEMPAIDIGVRTKPMMSREEYPELVIDTEEDSVTVVRDMIREFVLFSDCRNVEESGGSDIHSSGGGTDVDNIVNDFEFVTANQEEGDAKQELGLYVDDEERRRWGIIKIKEEEGCKLCIYKAFRSMNVIEGYVPVPKNKLEEQDKKEEEKEKEKLEPIAAEEGETSKENSKLRFLVDPLRIVAKNNQGIGAERPQGEKLGYTIDDLLLLYWLPVKINTFF